MVIPSAKGVHITLAIDPSLPTASPSVYQKT